MTWLLFGDLIGDLYLEQMLHDNYEGDISRGSSSFLRGWLALLFLSFELLASAETNKVSLFTFTSSQTKKKKKL